MDSIKQRLLSNIKKDSKGCWIWQRSKSSSGYGTMAFDGKPEMCHRVSYILFVGNIPKKSVVMHTCDKPLCVNYLHLKVGSQKDNVEDMRSKRRNNFCISKYAKQGEKNYFASITSDLARKIKLMIKEKISTPTIIKKLQVTRGVVESIRYNNNWKHIIV